MSTGLQLLQGPDEVKSVYQTASLHQADVAHDDWSWQAMPWAMAAPAGHEQNAFQAFADLPDRHKAEGKVPVPVGEQLEALAGEDGAPLEALVDRQMLVAFAAVLLAEGLLPTDADMLQQAALVLHTQDGVDQAPGRKLQSQLQREPAIVVLDMELQGNQQRMAHELSNVVAVMHAHQV